MRLSSPASVLRAFLLQSVSFVLAVALLASPICAQRPAAPVKAPAPRETAPRLPDPTFDNLLAADRYKLYGEVRNVGQLLGTGSVGEIVDPIIKLADPPQEFSSIIKFLKTNAEALATARLLFATWPARSDVPNAFVAIEFATAEEATKFAPKLETFLPTVLPPVPEPTPEPSPTSSGPMVTKPALPRVVGEVTITAPPKPAAERLPFVMSHTGNLVLISDKSFKFEKLHPVGSKSLFEDQNFRIAHDRFSTEPVFVFINVALEEQAKPKVTQTITPEEVQKIEDAKAEAAADAESQQQVAIARKTQSDPTATPQFEPNANEPRGVLTAGPEPSPMPTPTREQQAQAVATSQIGHMLDSLGFGGPQWPEAVGLALTLDNQDYVIKALLIDAPDAKKLPLPFVPQLISGPASAPEAPSVLPDDTEVFVTASIDFLQTYEGMRKAAEARSKADARSQVRVYQNIAAEEASAKEPALDSFAEFEKKAKIKIKDDLLPAFGNEIALAGSLKSLQSAGIGIAAPAAKPSPEDKDDKDKKAEMYPTVLIAVRDREAARRVMPRVLDGLGFGEANMIASVEKREDTELVNYAGIFAYAFVGNFVVISEAATVRRIIDANINHQTLSSNQAFRSSRRWEPSRTLGQVYISPALMEGYHNEVRLKGSTIDPAMRDFLLGLDPTASAITYAQSNDGLGTQHEIHLPRNLILTTVAGISSATKNPPPEMNEGIAIGMLGMIAGVEKTYQSTSGKGKYGTLDELVAQKLVQKDMFDKYGYNFEVTVMGDQFQAVATPREYGKTGKRSFFVDKSGVVRGDDHGGAAATSADKPVQN
jgi:hypothetical protein